MKKGIIKSALAIAAVAAVGLGSYKAYDAYKVANMSDEDLLMAENVLALSENHSELRRIAWHKVYKIVFTKIQDVYDKNTNEKLGTYYNVQIVNGYWQTCDNVSNSTYPTCSSDICTSEACAISKGYKAERPSIKEGIVFLTED